MVRWRMGSETRRDERRLPIGRVIICTIFLGLWDSFHVVLFSEFLTGLFLWKAVDILKRGLFSYMPYSTFLILTGLCCSSCSLALNFMALTTP